MENEDVQGAENTVYEVGYLILPSIPEESLSNVVSSIKAVIAKEGGKELDGEEPFKQELAYTMSKTVGASRYVVSDAYLGWLKFEIDGAKAPAVKAGLDKRNELLRFLLIKAPRETVFTFAKARKALEEKDEVVAPTLEEVGVPTETSGNNI